MVEAAEDFRLTWFNDGTYTVEINGKSFPFLLTEFPTWEQINGSGVYEVTVKFVSHGITQVNRRG